MIMIQCMDCNESVEAKTKQTKRCTQCAYVRNLTSERKKNRSNSYKLAEERKEDAINDVQEVDDFFADRSAFDALQG